MQLLILGGGVFLGAAALRSALAGGHRVTVFNRGRSCSVWPAGVEVLTSDRSADLSPLDHRSSTTWDAVIDTCGYVPAGLRTRPLRDTLGAVLDEGLPAPDDKRRAGKLSRDREAQLLAAWAVVSAPVSAPIETPPAKLAATPPEAG